MRLYSQIANIMNEYKNLGGSAKKILEDFDRRYYKVLFIKGKYDYENKGVTDALKKLNSEEKNKFLENLIRIQKEFIKKPLIDRIVEVLNSDIKELLKEEDFQL